MRNACFWHEARVAETLKYAPCLLLQAPPGAWSLRWQNAVRTGRGLAQRPKLEGRAKACLSPTERRAWVLRSGGLAHVTLGALRVTGKLAALWTLQPGTRPNAGVSPPARVWRGLRGARSA